MTPPRALSRRIHNSNRTRDRARRCLDHRAAPHNALHHGEVAGADAAGPAGMGVLADRLRAPQRPVHFVRWHAPCGLATSTGGMPPVHLSRPLNRFSPAGVAAAPVGEDLLVPREGHAHAAARETAGSLHATLLRLLRFPRGDPAWHHFARRRERQRRLLLLCVGLGAARRQRGPRRLGHLRDRLQDDRRRRHDGLALRGH